MKQKRKLETILKSPCAIINTDDKLLYVGLLYSCTKIKSPDNYNLLLSDSGLKDFSGTGRLKEDVKILNKEFIYIENDKAYYITEDKEELIDMPKIEIIDNPTYYDFDDSIVNYSVYTIQGLRERARKIYKK